MPTLTRLILLGIEILRRWLYLLQSQICNRRTRGQIKTIFGAFIFNFPTFVYKPSPGFGIHTWIPCLDIWCYPGVLAVRHTASPRIVPLITHPRNVPFTSPVPANPTSTLWPNIIRGLVVPYSATTPFIGPQQETRYIWSIFPFRPRRLEAFWTIGNIRRWLSPSHHTFFPTTLTKTREILRDENTVANSLRLFRFSNTILRQH